MQLGDIFDDETFDVATAGIEITRVEIDSRQCTPGTLFFAMPGHEHDGAQFVAEAVERGVVAVVASHPVVTSVPVVLISTSCLAGALAHASAAVTQFPQRELELVGVTGTNGKTSVTTLVADLARQLGWHGANIGTLTNVRTTPAAPELFRILNGIRTSFHRRADHHVVALEVSSHALDQQRVAGLHFEVAAFTNLSHDHLDYHGDMETYFAAKSELFTSEYTSRAVIWTDDPYGARLRETTSLPVTAVSRADASDVTMSLEGTAFFWRGHLVNSSLVGDYNVDNALLAMAIVSSLGANDAEVAAAMGRVHAVRGRFEVVHRGAIDVVVDYAHTPDGLDRLLRAVRELGRGRVITVFGCGGDRDRDKRPVMGRVASSLSDLTVVTSDNPRSEDPERILDAVLEGIDATATVWRCEDRRQAIALALEAAQPGDVVVVAGKGHETTQQYGDRVLAFDDRATVHELLK